MKLLRWALIVDAVASGLIGIGDVALNRMMSDLLGVPRGLLYGLGAVLIAWDVALLVLATRRTVNRPAVGVVIALNLIWALDSVVMVEAGWYPLTGAGIGLIIFQAVAVVAFAVAQYVGLRVTRRVPAVA